MRDYLAATRERVVVFDGSMGATLEQYDLDLERDYRLPGRCHEALVLNRPDVIQGLHESMVDVGADAVETDTFQASRLKLDEWGLGEHTYEINRKAAEIARRAVGEQRFVAGSIGPTGHLPASDDPTLGVIRFRELVAIFEEQARGLVDGGADLLIIETAQDILEVKAAIFGAREAFATAGRAVPLQASISLLPNGGKMLLGTDISAALATLEALKVDVIGLNCSTGPEDMRDAVRFLGEFCPVPVQCIPNAGIPHQGPDGETIFPEEPGPLADVLGEFVERYGVSIVGGCCGTTTEHIRAIVERVGGRAPSERPAPRPPHVSSMMTATPIAQDPAPDAGGRARELAGLAQGQGAAARGRLRRARPGRRGPGGGRRPRARPVRRVDGAPGRGRADAPRGEEGLAQPAGADPGRLDRAGGDLDRARPDPRPRDRQLDQPGGRAGEARPRRADRHGARRRADRLTIDEVGMAKTRERKLEIARGITSSSATSTGWTRAADLRRADLHAHHRRRRVEAVRGRDDRGHPPDQGELPGVQDLARRLQRLFGIGARARGAQLRLPPPLRGGRARPRDGQPEPHHAVRRDPDGERELADDLVFNRREDALERFIAHFESKSGEAEAEAPTRPRHGARGGAALAHPARKRDGVEDQIDQGGGEARRRPTLNDVLLPAMKEVGDKFGAAS
jgi:5-methyltetrahydrofolate--homocysteine methyltransferase